MSATMFGGRARLCCPSCGDAGELMTEERVTVRYAARFSDAGDAPKYTGHRRETLDEAGTWTGDVHCFACKWSGLACELVPW